MPEFSCSCLNTQGRKVSISINASSEREASGILRDRGLVVINIVEAGEGFNLDFLSRVKRKEVILFFRMFASLVKSDVSVSEAVSILEDQAESVALRKIITEIREHIESGGSISDAMEPHERFFTPMAVNMIRAGELGGILDIALERIAQQLEESAELRSKILLSLMYPSIVVVVTLILVFFLSTFVIPRFASLLGTSSLPANTQFLLDASDFIQKNGFKIVGYFSAFIGGIIVLARAEATRDVTHRMALEFPVVGEVLRYGAIVRFSKTMSALLESNINLIDALKASGDTISNRAVNAVVERMIQRVLSGDSLSSALEGDSVFTPMMKAMVKIGEHSGLMDESMHTSGELHEKILENKIARMSAMIEPALIIMIGIVVGYVVWGLISGMLALYSSVR